MKHGDPQATTSIGRGAEDRVAQYLKKKGWKVLDQNWRNRWCEIDVIASEGNRVIFVEVKYRARQYQGDGFEAVTGKKLERMARAAEAWVQSNHWEGEYELVVASVTADTIEIRGVY